MVDPSAKIWQLPVGVRQRVEIIKALSRGANLLILDEPTSVLAPPEIHQLFSIMRRLATEDRGIIFITHKLNEVMEISNRVTVLREGKVVGTFNTSQVDPLSLARMMIGREFLPPSRKSEAMGDEKVLEVVNLRALNDKGVLGLQDVSFSIRRGEIFGIAGVEGNGQNELAEVLAGLRKPIAGQIFVCGREITQLSPRNLIDMGVCYIPEDRLGAGLITNLSICENLVIDRCHCPPFCHNWLLDYAVISAYAKDQIQKFDISPASPESKVKILSGGNQQKVVLARVLSRCVKVLIAFRPTQGLDVGASEYVQQKLLEQRENGTAILLISGELQELLSLSDRIAVFFNGQISGIISPEAVDVQELGLMMAGMKRLEPVG